MNRKERLTDDWTRKARLFDQKNDRTRKVQFFFSSAAAACSEVLRNKSHHRAIIFHQHSIERSMSAASNPLSLLLKSNWTKDSPNDFNPFTYKFHFNDLKPSIGEPFSYFTQASWTICSASILKNLRSDIPVRSSSTEWTLSLFLNSSLSFSLSPLLLFRWC